MRKRCALLAILSFALGPAVLAGDENAGASKLEWSGDVMLSSYVLDNAYFGSPDEQPYEPNDSSYGWLESVARLHLDFAATEKIKFAFEVVGMGTLGADPFGWENDSSAMIEIANVSFRDLGFEGLSLTLGRQEIIIGDGFLIADGFSDDRAAIWSIPLRSWDAARVDYESGEFAALAFVATLSDSFGPQEGELYGVDFLWTPDDGADETESAAPAQPAGAAAEEAEAEDDDEEESDAHLGLGAFARSDDGEEDIDAQLISVRGSMPVGPLVLAGEYAIQSGSMGEVDLGGEAYHADITWNLPFERSPYLLASWLVYSGDDPETEEDETFFYWNYGSEDWSRYYLGEIMGSTLLYNQDQQVLKLEGGFNLTKSASLRLFYVDISADTGAYWEFPEGVGKDIATEFDAVIEWAASDDLEFWLLLGVASPGDAAKAIYGDETTRLIAASGTWSF